MNLNLGFFSRARLWQKFLLLGVVTLPAAILPTYQVYVTAKANVDRTQTQLNGVGPAKAVVRLLQLMQQHRDLAAAVLAGDKTAAGDLAAKASKINETVAEIDAIVRKDTDPQLSEEWRNLRSSWTRLAALSSDTSNEPKDIFDQHSALCSRILVLLAAVRDHFVMSLDTGFETYYLNLAAFFSLPQATEESALARAFGAARLTAANRQRSTGAQDPAVDISPVDRVRMSALIDSGGIAIAGANQNFEKVFFRMPRLRTNIEGHVSDTVDRYRGMARVAHQQIIDGQSATYDQDRFTTEFSQGIDAQFALIGATAEILSTELGTRLTNLSHAERQLITSLVVLVSFALVLGFSLVRGVTQRVGRFYSALERLKAGDTEARAGLTSRDEIGELAQQFDQMMDERQAVADKIRTENDRLNNSIVELLGAAGRLSQKDLTVRAPVAEDVTGALSDAINTVAEETGKVLSEVVNVAHQVALSAQEVKSQSGVVMGVATDERKTVEKAAIDLGHASEKMLQIAKLATLCNAAAVRAISSTNTAEGTVLSTVEGITQIRETIRETEKRIKRLGERSQEISGVVSLINSIAERTHILALNASMHAASAGEAGRGFAVVANEVQRLAENAQEATSKIAELVRNIQVETSDTVVTMNDAITKVVSGTELAERAGAQMRETRTTTAELVTLVQQIATDSEEQAQATEGLRKRAGEIEASTQRTFEKLQDQLEHTNLLVTYSDTLLSSVTVFRLPQSDRKPIVAFESTDTSLSLSLPAVVNG
jgi:methyl-accepting chemotaxis protein